MKRSPFRRLVPLCAMLVSMVSMAAHAAGACDNPQTVIDTRSEPLAKEAALPTELRAALVREAFGADVAVSIGGSAAGAFTIRGASERAYVLDRNDPDASPVDPIQAALAIVADGKPVRVVKTALGQRLGGTVAGAGKAGADALLLRADAYNMGQASSRLVLVELDGDGLVEKATYDEAYVNACDDTRFGGFVEAIRVSRCSIEEAPAAWHVERLRADCVNGKAPMPQAYRPAVQGKP